MLQVFTSNQTENLIAQLVLQITAQRQILSGPFDPIRVIVPDARVATFLKLQLAKQMGVLDYVDFVEWDDFLQRMLTRHGDLLMDRRILRSRLVEVLDDDELLKLAELAPVRRYLGERQADDDALERRRFQLANQIAQRFMDYAYARPSLLESWGREERWFDQSVASNAELWQAILWRALTARFTTPLLVSPRDVAARLTSQDLSAGKMLHIFPYGCLSPVMYEIIEAASAHTILFGYGLDPSQQYWADVRFGRPEEEKPLFSSVGVDGGHMEYAGDDSFWGETQAPMLMRAWGYAGAQHARALAALEGCELRPLFEQAMPYHPGLLHQMQADMLDLATPQPEPEHDPHDHSLSIFACPNIKREVEVIATEIVALVSGEAPDGGPPLAYHDIAVLLPEPQREAYQTHLRAVFPTTQQIPYNMIDMPALSWSRASEAVQMLLALPFGQFRRQELLRLLTHPNVIGRFSNIDPRDWMQWCDELRILHGADRSDHADTYIESELFHWEQGFRRLVLGAFMTGKPAGDRRAFELGKYHYLPHEYEQGQLPSAARLVLMGRSMIEDARFCRQAHMPLRRWAEFLCRMVSTYIAPEEPGDEMLLHECRRLLAAMGDHDPGDREISYRVAYEVAMDWLSELEIKRGQVFLEGVSIMGLEQARPLPFRVIFVAGLGEGSFPQAEPRRPEDLRFATDKDGEMINAVGAWPDIFMRDRQKWAFLETFLCARDRLYLSYVARDPRTGEVSSPSAVVNELLWAIEQDYTSLLPGESEQERLARVEKRWITHHELRRFHERYFPGIYAHASPQSPSLTPSMQPEAKREAITSAMRAGLDEVCHAHKILNPTRRELQAILPKEQWTPLGKQLGLFEPPERQSGEEGEVLRLSTFELRAFLECPLQGSARFLLRLDEDEEDLLLKESELFEASGMARMSLLRDVFWEKLAREHEEQRALDFGHIYDDRARYFELEGLVPTGPFYSAARERNLKVLSMWQDNMVKLGFGVSPKMEVRRFGRPREHEHVDVAMPPLMLDLALPERRVKIEISGRTESILPMSATTLITHPTEKAYFLSPKYFMRGFLDYVILAARGEEQNRNWNVVINPAEEVQKYKLKNCERSFEPIDPSTARNYLRGVITDMLTRVHAYYLPIEVAFEHVEQERPVAQIAELKRHNPWKPTSSDFGPVRDAGRFEPPEDAEAMIRKRYGLYFEQLRGKKRR